jgi:hypothetical protein
MPSSEFSDSGLGRNVALPSLVVKECGRYRPVLVLAEKHGRLGNHLLNFSSWITLARKHDWTIWNYGFKRYAELFQNFCESSPAVWPLGCDPPGVVQNALLSALIGASKWVEAKTQLRMDEQLGWFSAHSSAAGVGYLAFDWRHPGRLRKNLLRPTMENYAGDEVVKYVERHRMTVIDSNVPPDDFSILDPALLRHTFAVRIEAAERISDLMSTLRASHEVIIGVHMRMTDYRFWEGGKWFISQERYAEVVKSFAQAFGPAKPVFVLCSDEPVQDDLFREVCWCRGPGDVIGDLEALTQCDRILCTESTFSGWASFVGRVPRYVVQNDGAVPGDSDFYIFGSAP